MIKNATKIFLTLALALFGGLTTAQAQMDSDTILDVNIPFQFVVANTTFPAGKYTIRPIDDSEDTPNVIEISSADGRMRTLFDTENTSLDNAPKKSEIVFDKYGNNYFLSQIFVEDEKYGVQAEESKMEKKWKKNGQQAVKQSVQCSKRKSSSRTAK
ncbi:MAG TPA: hypothetical protein VF556_13865 [Pyrinomonadaceae bacterium]|jgi:hypothetical protein